MFSYGQDLLAGIILNDEPLLQQLQIPRLQIKVAARDRLLAIGRCQINYLRRIFAQVVAVVLIQALAVLSREDPHVLEPSVADVLQVPFKSRQRRRFRRAVAGRSRGVLCRVRVAPVTTGKARGDEPDKYQAQVNAMPLSDHAEDHSRPVQLISSNFGARSLWTLHPKLAVSLPAQPKRLAAIVLLVIGVVACIWPILVRGLLLLLIENMQDRAVFVLIDDLKPATVHGFGGKL